MNKYSDDYYKNDPEAREYQEFSRPDEVALYDKLNECLHGLLDLAHQAKVLDMCCGTGPSMKVPANHPGCSELVGVDNNQIYLDYAKDVYKNTINSPKLICADALSESILLNDHWDIVILSSAYHHIEDNRKQLFLNHIYRLIKKNGVIIFAENILSEYERAHVESYRNSVREFYNEVIKTARMANPDISDEAIQLIQHVAQYGIDGHTEYKVNYEVFKQHVANASLTIEKEYKVWPFLNKSIGIKGGNYIFLARRT